MADNRTEMEKRAVLRLSNEESNRITRECLQTALIILLSEKEMDKISITELVKRAGVSRTAFYSNYSSKEEVLVSLSDEMLNGLNQLAQKAIAEQEPLGLYLQIFRSIKQESGRFSSFMKAGLQNREFFNIRDILSTRYPGVDIQIRYLIFAWGGMIQNIILDWFLNGMNEEIEEMAALCCSLSEPIIRRIKEIDPDFSKNYFLS